MATTLTPTPSVATSPEHAIRRYAWAGIAFPILFILSVVVSNPPADTVPLSTWTANYTGSSEQLRHFATGVLLVLAAVSLTTFIAGMWTRSRGRVDGSPLALVMAAAGGAAIAVGGVVMAAISGSELIDKYPLPSPELLRFSNDLGFALVAVAGMPAVAVAVAAVSASCRAAGVIGRRMAIFGYVVAVALLAAITFVPILLLVIWVLVTAISWLRAVA